MGDEVSRQREAFANRFEPDGDGYLFRTHLRAPGIGVSADERDRFVAAYSRRIRVTSWVSAMLVLPVLAIVSWILIQTGADLPWWGDFAAMAPCVAVYLIPVYWLWRAPDRALRGRPPRAAGRTRDEARYVGKNG